MKRWLALALILAAAVGLALRWPDLDRRPMHHDESVNARIFQGLLERGDYRYDPDEYHGPTLHYATLPIVWLCGVRDFDHLSERSLRTVAVIAGVALVLMVGLLRDGLGTVATALSALLLALSPAMVFYSRYFIHEMLLVAFTLLLLGGVWRYRQTQRSGWALVAGAALGLMHATKETFVINLAAMGSAILLTLAWQRWRDGRPVAGKRSWKLGHLALALATAALVSLALFTSFGSNGRGPFDSVVTYLPWLRRAGGQSPHLHPWYFYFERLFGYRAVKGPLWTEAWIGLLAGVGCAAALSRQTQARIPESSVGLARFLVFYTVVITAAYAVIAYKTPWCLLNFLLPMILLAGLGAAAMLRAAGFPKDVAARPAGDSGSLRPKWALAWMAVVFAGATAQLAWQSWRASHSFTNHRGHPYVYAQTLPNALELVNRVKAIAAVSPGGAETQVKVIAPQGEYWPLPWYLRQLRNVWWLDDLPDNPYAPIIIVAADLKAALDDRSQRRYLSVGYYELRPRVFLELYVEFELWKRFVATLPRPAQDDDEEEEANDSPLSP